MNLARWRLYILVALAAAIGLAAVVSTDDDLEPPGDEAPAAAGASERRQRSAAAAPVRVELERLSRAPAQGDADHEPGNAFGAMSWQAVQQAEPEPEPTLPVQEAPAASPPARPEPAPPPRAPALPFTFLGRYEDAETHLVMLVKGERIHTVARGDVIEGTYRVDRIDEQQVELTYLPLDQKQSLATGGRS